MARSRPSSEFHALKTHQYTRQPGVVLLSQKHRDLQGICRYKLARIGFAEHMGVAVTVGADGTRPAVACDSRPLHNASVPGKPSGMLEARSNRWDLESARASCLDIFLSSWPKQRNGALLSTTPPPASTPSLSHDTLQKIGRPCSFLF